MVLGPAATGPEPARILGEGMRRKRLLLVILGGLLGTVLLGFVTIYVGLPALVKVVALHQIRGLLGREVSIERVRLDLWNGWYQVKNIRIAGRPGEAPFVEIGEVDLRLIYSYLFQGQVRAHQIAVTSPVVRLARLASGDLSIADIIERFAPDEKKPADEQASIELLADLILVSNGAVLVEDRAVTPARTFEMRDLSVNLRNITTRRHAGQGTGSISFVLNGAPVAVVARDVRISPTHVKAQLNVVDFDVDEVWAYLPPGAAARPAGGRLSTSIDLAYDATGGATANMATTVADLTLVREGQAEPLLWLPEVRVAVKDLVARDGGIALGRLEVDTDTSIVDESISPARRYDVSDIHLVVDNAVYPAGPPAQLQLSMGLPEGAALDVRGTASPAPLAANLAVTLADVDLTLANPYIPPAAPLLVERGRLGATLAVDVTAGPAVRVNGEVVAGYSLILRDRTQPLVIHPRVVAKIMDLTWQAGAGALRRLTVDGPATIIDPSLSPPRPVDFTALSLQVDDTTFPVQRPVRLRSSAAVGTEGTATFEGTFNPATQAADIRARFADVAVTRAAPYIPPTVPVAVTGGRLAATVLLKNDPTTGLTINADGAVAGLAVEHGAEPRLSVTDQRLAFAADDVRIRGDALAIRRASLKGAPAVVVGSVTPPRSLALRALNATVRGVAWPARRPVAIELAADLPEAGTLTAIGSANLDGRAVDMQIDVKGAAIGPYAVLLPFDAPLGGEATAGFTVAARMASDVSLTGAGRAELRQFTLGPPDRPAVRIERVETTGIRLGWPGELRVDLVKIAKPLGLLEREKDGSFPLRAMLTPRDQRGGAPPSGAPPPAPAAPAGGTPPSKPALTVAIREVLIEDGSFRFVDHSTTPSYSEEISQVAAKVANVTTAPGERITMTMQALVGATGALDLKGEIAPTADPFYLDVQGELREFPLSRTNPYFRQVFDWFLKRGSITNKIHYRVEGDKLTAENDVRVQRLGVEKDSSPVASDKKIGVPLGLIVAMVTDRRGDIEFSLPVSGNLSQPGFSVGGAIWAALKNVLTNMVTAPFQAIGKLFSKGDEVQEFKVDPVAFPPGSAAMGAQSHQHLQRVADFLRASPNIRLELRPVVSADDLEALKTAAVTARIQRVQRDEKLDDFAAAAAKVFAETFPGQPRPDSTDKIVERLREKATVPETAAQELASKRLEATRQALVQAGGLEAARLGAVGTLAGGPGQGRVEFELTPGAS
jgi:hypothetical protein